MSDVRNVLFIVVDQWRGDTVSYLGHPCIKTPHLDALCRDGVTFCNHYVQGAPCAPARASLLTGQYMMTHRVVQNGIPMDARHNNLAYELRRLGYDPALVGYTTTTLDPRELAADPDDIWLPADTSATSASRIAAEYSDTSYATKHGLAYLQGMEGRPWALHLGYYRPHPPFIAPAPYNAAYDPSDVPAPIRANNAAVEGERRRPGRGSRAGKAGFAGGCSHCDDNQRGHVNDPGSGHRHRRRGHRDADRREEWL